jgi:putative transcriptional regulator
VKYASFTGAAGIMTIYIRIKEMRALSGITQQALADRCGMKINAIQKYEYQQNKSIPFDTLEKLCVALECSPGDLLEIK